MDRYPDYTISDFFCEMTMGQLDLIGDEYNIVLPNSSLYYKDTVQYNRSTLNAYVLNYLNQTQNIDWSRYDKWTRSGSNFTWGADGTAEMIIINYREIPNNESGWFWNPGWGGEASLQLYAPITFGNVTIGCDNGITALNMLHNTTHSELILEHEFAHKLFGSNFYGNYHINLGMMTPGHDPSTYAMSPMERSNPIVGYIQQPSIITQTGTYTLEDYIETGQVLKIAIPGTSDFYWIANHQKKSVYDGISRGGKTCYNLNFAEQDPYCPEGKGIYVYREGFNCTNFNEPYDIVSSEGKYIWNIDQWAYAPYQNYHHHLGFNLPTFLKTSSDRIYGRDNYQKIPNPTVTAYGEFIIDDVCSDYANDIFVSWSNRGNGKNAFNIGHDEIFSPYSNPSTRTGNNPNNMGLTIELQSQNQYSGEIQLKIYYNDDANAVSDCAPSKPKGIKHDFYYPIFGWCVPKISWDHNIEPDMLRDDNTKRYQVWRATEPDMSNCSNFSGTYSLIYEGNFYADTPPEYIDYSVLEYNCADLDQLPPFGTRYPVRYKVKAVDISDKISVFSDFAVTIGISPEGGIEDGGDNPQIHSEQPKEFALSQNYPNPFNPVTKINFTIPKSGFVTLKIYDMLGREIKTLVNEPKQPGYYTVDFNGMELSSGIYFYRIQMGDLVQVKRMILTK